MLPIHRSGKKRKGQWTPSAKLAVFIVTIATLLLLVVIFARIRDIGENSVDKEACKQSIRLNAHTKLTSVVGFDAGKYLVDRYGNVVNIQCATEYLVVKGDKPEILQKKIADSMVDCWQMYGEGDLEVFDTKDNNYCAVCSRLEFKEETQLPGFTKFLMTNQAPRQETTYLEYFQGAGRRCGADSLSEEEIATLVDQSGLNELDTLDTSSPLAVMFVMDKTTHPDSLFGTGKIKLGKLETTTFGIFGGTAIAGAGLVLCATIAGCTVGGPLIIIGTLIGASVAGGVGGYMVGAACTADYGAYVALWDYSDLKSLNCTYLESEATPLKVKEI